ncbi:urease accessory protein UreE [Flavobacterium sp. FBOR7N2.3]|uniref:Urease accessory protein UreE n=1 Tax=Flavobacterium magnesitis TaxID=3138077 RepID=A0ABV4TH60_9FLAO
MIITTKIQPEVLSLEPKTEILIDFEWFETNKRIQHKTARDGKSFRMKFLNENPNLAQGEILSQEEDKNYVVNILPCDCLVIVPKNNFETASICYEIGNKHLPLFYEDEALLVPFEKPLFRQLSAMGFEVHEQKRVLLTPLRTSVAPHGESGTLFSKIMNLTQK